MRVLCVSCQDTDFSDGEHFQTPSAHTLSHLFTAHSMLYLSGQTFLLWLKLSQLPHGAHGP